MAERKAVTREMTRRYAKASTTEKGRMLDELCALTGWTRRHARRSLLGALDAPTGRCTSTRPGEPLPTSPAPWRCSSPAGLALPSRSGVRGGSLGRPEPATKGGSTLPKASSPQAVDRGTRHEVESTTQARGHRYLQRLRARSKGRRDSPLRSIHPVDALVCSIRQPNPRHPNLPRLHRRTRCSSSAATSRSTSSGPER
jgi:hypothetical protein